MNFLVHMSSEYSQTRDAPRLGHAYSALIDAYALALGKLGAVQIAEDISAIEFDPREGKSLLLWFGPVEQIPASLTIPVLPVVDSGPLIDKLSRPIEGIIRDWAHHLRRCGQAITTSSSIERGIKATLGEGFRVATIPPPMTAPTLDPELRLSSRFTAGQLKLKAESIVLDSSAIKLCADLLVPAARPRTSDSDPLTKPVLQRSTGRDLCAPDDRAMSTLVEDAPHEIATLKMHAADCKATYVSAIGTTEARSNWYDLVTAFCWTFRHAPNATLILQYLHSDRNAYLSPLIEALCRLTPFECRVIAVPGYLDELERKSLITAATYFVHSWGNDDLCLQLLDFMACGVPALTPTHAPLADYTGRNSGLCIRSGVADALGIDKPASLLGASYRLNWDALCDSLRQSAQLATDAEQYGDIARHSSKSILETCSIPAVAAQLSEFLQLQPTGSLAPPA